MCVESIYNQYWIGLFLQPRTPENCLDLFFDFLIHGATIVFYFGFEKPFIFLRLVVAYCLRLIYKIDNIIKCFYYKIVQAQRQHCHKKGNGLKFSLVSNIICDLILAVQCYLLLKTNHHDSKTFHTKSMFGMLFPMYARLFLKSADDNMIFS